MERIKTLILVALLSSLMTMVTVYFTTVDRLVANQTTLMNQQQVLKNQIESLIDKQDEILIKLDDRPKDTIIIIKPQKKKRHYHRRAKTTKVCFNPLTTAEWSDVPIIDDYIDEVTKRISERS